MPRIQRLAKRPARSKVHTVLPGEVHEQVDLFCAQHGISECEFFRRATLEKLTGAGDAKQLAREIRSQRRTTRETQFQSEFNTQLLSKLLLLVMSGIASLPKEERAANERQARALHKAVVAQTLQEMTAGSTLVAELREQLRAEPSDDAEQCATPSAARGARRHRGPEPLSASS